MLTKIDNDADHFAILQSVDLETATWPRLLAELIKLAPDDEDVEIIIRKDVLSDAYRVNPSALARLVMIKSDSFQSYGTYQIGRHHLGIKFLRDERHGRHHIVPPDNQSTFSRIRAWLDADKSEYDHLDIPMANVPESYRTRPEQLVYQIRRLTDQHIRIQKLKTIFRVSLKNS